MMAPNTASTEVAGNIIVHTIIDSHTFYVLGHHNREYLFQETRGSVGSFNSL